MIRDDFKKVSDPGLSDEERMEVLLKIIGKVAMDEAAMNSYQSGNHKGEVEVRLTAKEMETYDAVESQKITRESLADVFNKFVGKSVKFVDPGCDDDGRPFDRPTWLDQEYNDPVIQEMHELAKDNGIKLRIYAPQRLFQLDMLDDKEIAVNEVIAYVQYDGKGDSGVQPKFRVRGKTITF
jgi:hypothetical protein